MIQCRARLVCIQSAASSSTAAPARLQRLEDEILRMISA